MAGRDQYDISPRHREILEFRASRRNNLRQEYLEQSLSPYRQGSVQGAIFDEQMQRMFTMKAVREKFLSGKLVNFQRFFLFMVVPGFTTYFSIRTLRRKKEAQMRTGQISYRDRHLKFI